MRWVSLHGVAFGDWSVVPHQESYIKPRLRCHDPREPLSRNETRIQSRVSWVALFCIICRLSSVKSCAASRAFFVLLKVFNDRIGMGQAAAEQASAAIRRAIAERGHARIIA